MKGIILAGGKGSRLFPITSVNSKQLLPIYDKPLIYYSLTTLMSLGIKEIILISSNEFLKLYKKLLGNGHNIGISIKYLIQNEPKGIADAFLVAQKYIKYNKVTLILGDNIFFGDDINNNVVNNFKDGSHLFLNKVKDPERYGVASIDKKKLVSIEEKPKKPKTNLAVTGLYFYDEMVIEFSRSLKPSKRKELEITDLNNLYIKKNKVNYTVLQKGSIWLDAGTPDALLQSSEYVKTIQERQQIQIGCPEEIALKNNWISKSQFKKLPSLNYQNSYSDYLKSLI